LLVRDDFAGAGGWSQALKLSGYSQDEIGYENNPVAVATARAAGHTRELIDVLDVDSTEKLYGYLASPPCTPFSVAGKGEGKEILRQLIGNPGAAVDPKLKLFMHPFDVLVRQSPEWFIFENVPFVMKYWKYMATLLDYNVKVVKLYADNYGVPQSRIRVFMIGSRGLFKVPAPTHDRYAALKTEVHPDLPPPVSMRDALKLSPTITNQISFYNKGGGDGGAGNRRATDLPSLTITSKSFAWEDTKGNRQIAGSQQGSVLQSFPNDYPWYGNSKQRWLQIGNAVPPKLGAAIIKELL